MRLTIIVCVLTALVTSVAAYKIHSWRVDALRLSWEVEKIEAVNKIKAEVQGICDENNKITKEKARALQNKYDIINRNYDRLLKYSASGAGSSAPSSSPGRNNGAPGTDMLTLCIPLADAARIGKLSDNQAAALVTLQDVVAEIYKAGGQANLLPEDYLRE